MDSKIKRARFPGDYVISVSADPTDAGTVTGDGVYAYRDSVTVEATANEGCAFRNWTWKEGGETKTSAENPYTFTPDADRDLVAYFLKPFVVGDIDSLTYAGQALEPALSVKD